MAGPPTTALCLSVGLSVCPILRSREPRLCLAICTPSTAPTREADYHSVAYVCQRKADELLPRFVKLLHRPR